MRLCQGKFAARKEFALARSESFVQRLKKREKTSREIVAWIKVYRRSIHGDDLTALRGGSVGNGDFHGLSGHRYSEIAALDVVVMRTRAVNAVELKRGGVSKWVVRIGRVTGMGAERQELAS